MALTHDAPALSLTSMHAALDRMDRLRGAALWAALGVAFSPVLLTWSRSADPGSKHSYLFFVAALFGHALWREGHGTRQPSEPSGIPTLALGIALELVGILGHTQFFMLLGLPVAALGLAIRRGWPTRSASALAFFLVPIPDAFLGLASPWLEMGLASGAASLLSPFGSSLGDSVDSVEAVGLSLVAGQQKLDLRPGNGGLLLVHFLAALGFAGSVSAGDGILDALGRAGRWSCAAIVVQPIRRRRSSGSTSAITVPSTVGARSIRRGAVIPDRAGRSPMRVDYGWTATGRCA